jgi:hypothetical protein
MEIGMYMMNEASMSHTRGKRESNIQGFGKNMIKVHGY